MEKYNDGKSKSHRESNCGNGNSSSTKCEHSKKRLQEPPKFYSKNYLKRYNHSEVKGTSPSPPSQPSGKKSSQTDQTFPNKTQQEVQNSPAVITISSTILKLADEKDIILNECSPAEISENENSINPYNRSQCSRESTRPKQTSEQDYRYSLANATSSVTSSFGNFKSSTETFGDEIPSTLCTSIPGIEEFSRNEWTKSDTFKRIKAKVEEAMKRRRVFLIRGEVPRLKEALEERGWIQKYESSRTRSLPYDSTSNLEAKSLGDLRFPDGTLNERAIIFALLRQAHPDLIWDCRNDFIEWDRNIPNHVLLNRFHRPSVYTSKLGMAQVLEEAHWIHESDVAEVLFPRSYNPGRDLEALVRDFRCSAAVAVLRCFVDHMQRANIGKETTTNKVRARKKPRSRSKRRAKKRQIDEKSIDNEDSAMTSLERIEFAIRCCKEQIAEYEHEDIDVENKYDVDEEEWHLFFEDCERLIYKPDTMPNLATADQDRLKACFTAAESVIEKMKIIDPQFELNGERNIWIVKPSNLCCGSGIFMTHDLKTILRKVESKPKDYYIVQKYIERPFLVHGTKFDIRQWFLVTSTFPMTIWSFKEALLRFSSKPYTHNTYHEAIHICNTAIQEKYDFERRKRKNRSLIGGSGGSIINSIGDESETSLRDQGWDCRKLNNYLKSIGYHGEPYYEKIYPKMSQAIVLTMLAAQDFMDRRRCSFELYGADFMVMEDLSVWLIEINTNPRMHPPSSRITQRLYTSVLDSLVKVVLDLPINPSSDTGSFELLFKQNIPDSQAYLGPCLFAFGKAMTLHDVPLKKRINIPGASERNSNIYSLWSKQTRPRTAPPPVDRQKKTKVVDFISYLNTTPGVSSYSTLQEDSEDSH